MRAAACEAFSQNRLKEEACAPLEAMSVKYHEKPTIKHNELLKTYKIKRNF